MGALRQQKAKPGTNRQKVAVGEACRTCRGMGSDQRWKYDRSQRLFIFFCAGMPTILFTFHNSVKIRQRNYLNVFFSIANPGRNANI